MDGSDLSGCLPLYLDLSTCLPFYITWTVLILMDGSDLSGRLLPVWTVLNYLAVFLFILHGLS